MLTVTDLMTCSFCPRKLFLIRVLGLKVPENAAMVRGSALHRVLEEVNKAEQEIIGNIRQPIGKDDLDRNYNAFYIDAAKQAFMSQREKLERFSIDIQEELDSILPYIKEEAASRADNAFRLMSEKKLFGPELWQSIMPKILSEQRISSEKEDIKGVVDRIDQYPDKVIPFELKSGAAPKEGVWPDHKLQLVAYNLLLKEKYPEVSGFGFVHYIKDNERRKVIFNPFLELELKKLQERSKGIIKSEEIPPHTKEKNKCSICDLKEQCYDPGFIREQLEKKALEH